MCYDVQAESSGWCSSHHLQGAGHIVAASHLQLVKSYLRTGRGHGVVADAEAGS